MKGRWNDHRTNLRYRRDCDNSDFNSLHFAMQHVSKQKSYGVHSGSKRRYCCSTVRKAWCTLKSINLKGMRFGKLTVSNRHSNKTGHGVLWSCRCECGNRRYVLTKNLNSGSSSACKVCAKGIFRDKKCSHGMKGTAVYYIWAGMKSRCHYTKNCSYPDYGGRGIKVCKRWFKFENFYKDMGDIPKGKQLDRKNTNGNYSKRNCRWATTTEQSRNRRISLKKNPPIELAKKLGISYSAAYMRRKREIYANKVS